MPKKVLVGFGIDVDAAAGWYVQSFTGSLLATTNRYHRRIDTQDGSKVDTVNISRGIFGALVGIDRLLDLCTKHNIKASWFVPAHTCESFPKQIAKIHDSGHEM